MVLIVTLLFVFVLTALVLKSIESALIENETASTYKAESIVFQVAESGLKAGEAAIRGEPIKLPSSQAMISYQEKLLSIDPCVRKRYQVDSTARYHAITVRLFSAYDWLSQTNKSSCKNEVGGKRFFWSTVIF